MAAHSGASVRPRDYAEAAERAAIPEGAGERFAGYGIMGLPFRSGDVIAMRRFPASSLGPGYTSVWHRDAGGRWTFYSDQDLMQSCNRYFGSAVAEAKVTPIEVQWPEPERIVVQVPGVLTCDARLEATPATRAMNAMGRAMPDALWRRHVVLAAMAASAGAVLRAGRLSMQGAAPNGQRFIANPRLIWLIPESTAILHGQPLGPVGPLAAQARLGDFWIPQRGLFAVGSAFFEPLDPQRHRAIPTAAVTRSEGSPDPS